MSMESNTGDVTAWGGGGVGSRAQTPRGGHMNTKIYISSRAGAPLSAPGGGKQLSRPAVIINCSAFVTRTRISLDLLRGSFHLRRHVIFFTNRSPWKFFSHLCRTALYQEAQWLQLDPLCLRGQADGRSPSDSSHFQTTCFFFT